MNLNHFSFILFLLLQGMSFSLAGDDLTKKTPPIILMSEVVPPYVYYDDKDELVGESLTKIQIVFKQAGIKSEIRIVSWKRALFEVQRTKNVMIYPVSRTSNREKLFTWIFPLHQEHLKIFGIKGEVDVNMNDITSGAYSFVCSEKTITCILLEELGVPDKAITRLSNFNEKQMIKMVLRGRVNFILSTPIAIEHLFKDMNLDIIKLVALKNYSIPVIEYLVAHPDVDDSLVDRLREAADITLGINKKH